MLLPTYLYRAYLVMKNCSVFSYGTALANPLAILWPADTTGAFRLDFTNGLMSESMAVWFGSMLLR